MFSCRRGDSEPKGHCVWRSGPDYEWLNSQLYGVRLNRLREYFLSHEERLDGKRIMYKILWYHLVSLNIIGNVHKRTSRFQDRRPSITAAVLGRWWRSSKSEKAGAEQEEDDGSQGGRRAEGGRRVNQIRPVIRMRLDDPLMMNCWDRPPAGLPNFRWCRRCSGGSCGCWSSALVARAEDLFPFLIG